MQEFVDLARMLKGQTGTVSSIKGFRLAKRLESLGIRPGSQVTKVSTLFNRGPVVVSVCGTEVALGFGMAKKVMIEPGPGQGECTN